MKNYKTLFILFGLLVGITSFASAEEKTPPSHRVVARIAGEVQGMDVQGHYLYVGYRDTFTAIDISDVEHPVEVGFLTTSKEILDVQIDGNLAYVGLNFGLWVVDISDPTNPNAIATYDDLPVWRIELDGNYAYTAQAYHMRVWDISDPTNIQEIANYEALPHPLSGLNDIAMRDDGIVFVKGSGNSDTWVLDVTDPSHPTEIAIWEFAGWDIAVKNHILYRSDVGCSSTCRITLSTRDISDLTNPIILDAHQQPGASGFPMYALVTDGLYAYAGGHDGLFIYDVTDPNHIQDPEWFSEFPAIQHLALYNGYIFAATERSLNILAQPPIHRIYFPTIKM